MGRNNNDIDWGGWVLTIIMLGAFWPVGLVLLFRQLTGYSRKNKRQVKRHPYDEARMRQNGDPIRQQYQQTQWYAQQQGQAAQNAQQQGAAQNAQAQGAAPRTYSYGQQQTQGSARTVPQGNAQRGTWDQVKKVSPKEARAAGKVKKPGGLLTLVGGGLTAIFGMFLLMLLGDILGNGFSGYQFQPLMLTMGFTGAGLMCLYAGHRRRKEAKRYKKYLAYIGKNTEISIPALASAMGVKEKVVYEDLQDMLDDGVLPMGYIDVALGQLVLSDEGISRAAPQHAPEAKAEPEPVKKTIEDENAILQEIREVNDAIPDAVMSAKIDRIGEITGKILDYQRSHPSKSGQLRSFLNYYLPTTLKILRAYAQLDAQGIEGENISAAKKRIESMMDQVVDGFEKQLDKLFADDALDITSDVAVLENMLRKDGLSGDGMTLGGTPMAAEGGFSPQQAYLDLQKVADELESQKKDDGQITLQL